MKLTLELVSVDIRDESTPQSSTYFDLKIQNSKGMIVVENKQNKPYSIHEFALNDSENILANFWKLGEEEESILFGTALSLSNQTNFFVPKYSKFLEASKEKDTAKHEEVEEKKAIAPETNGNEKILIIQDILQTTSTNSVVLEILKKSSLNIDETQALLILEELVSFRISDALLKPSLQYENIKQSIEKYQEAMKSSISDRGSCYKSLYASFEKAVNADKGREGQSFDIKASNITGLSLDEIKDLHEFNNRDKHTQEGEEEIERYEYLKRQFDVLIANLKAATDKALLYRLNKGGFQ